MISVKDKIYNRLEVYRTLPTPPRGEVTTPPCLDVWYCYDLLINELEHGLTNEIKSGSIKESNKHKGVI